MIIKKITVFCAGIAAAVFIAAGCDKKIYLSTGLKEDELFKMSKEICMLPEALVVLTAEKTSYEKSYGEEIFNRQIEGVSLSAEVKKQIKTKLADIYGRKLFAIDRGITLSGQESAKLAEASEAFYATLSGEEISYLRISVDNIYSLYSAMYLGDKVYKSITDGVKYEVSDSEARVIRVQSIRVKDETVAKEAMSMLNEGSDFYTVAKKYTDDGQIEFEFGRGTIETKYENAAFALEKGGISDIVRTENGCYIIKCVEDYLEAKTLENKNIILRNHKNKIFDDIYKPFLKNISSEFNDELWDGITFAFTGNVKAAGLHAVYAEYMGNI